MNKRQAKKKIKKYHDRLFRDGINVIRIARYLNDDTEVNKILLIDADGTERYLDVKFNSVEVDAFTYGIQFNGVLLKMAIKGGIR